MSGTTISNSSTVALVLTALDQNPVIIIGSGTIDSGGSYAISGSTLTSWTIANDGRLAAASGSAISLQAGGSVTNGDAAHTAAQVNGYDRGIFIDGTIDAIANNFGTITAAGVIGTGVYLRSGGTVINGSASDVDAVITGYSGTYIGLNDRNSSLINFGTISATGSYGSAARLGTGGVTNGSDTDQTAAIRSDGEGITVFGPAGTVNNFGTIASTGTSNVGAVGVAIRLQVGGLVTNGSDADTAARISGEHYGIQINGTLAGSVANFGTIAVTGNDGYAMAAVYIEDGGTVINGSSSNTSADIAGYRDGVVIGGLAPGTVTNLATIEAVGTNVGAGVVMGYGSHLVNGSATDTTARIAGYNGAQLSAKAGKLTVQNYGTIVGESLSGLLALGGGTVVNGSSTDITALISAGTGEGVSFGGPGTFANYGNVLQIGTRGIGVLLGAAGAAGPEVATNGSDTDRTAVILGSTYGIEANNLGWFITNFATVSASQGDGVMLRGGGTLANGDASDSNATISGAFAGVAVYSGTPTISNHGRISGATYGVYAPKASAVITNAGDILGGGIQPAVYLGNGGTIVNQMGATIMQSISGASAVSITGSSGALVINSGLIDGIDLATGGSVSNLSGGIVAAPVLLTGGAGTLLNAGTIVGRAGIAVSFAGTFAHHLIVDPGASFLGTVDGGGTKATTLELAAGPSTGTLSGFGSQYIGFSQVTVDVGANWLLASNSTKPAGLPLINSGTLANGGVIASGVSLTPGAVLDNLSGGTITDTAGVAVFATSGAATLGNAGSIASLGSGAAVALLDGGLVSNSASGVINGAVQSGIYVSGARGTVFNAGDVSASGTSGVGVDLQAGGYVSNASGGVITGALLSGIYVTGARGTVSNTGSIAALGSSGIGVDLQIGGYVRNAAGGIISGAVHNGIYVGGSTGTVVNAGQVSSGARSAVDLGDGGSVINQLGGTLIGGAGHNGIYATGASAMITNAGVILGGGTSAGVHLQDGGIVTNQSGATISGIYIASTASGTLVVDPGAVFTGTVSGGSADGNMLELAAGLSVGTLVGLGSQFVNFGSIVFDTGADWFVSGSTGGLSGTISGFSPGDTIELTGITATGSSFSGGVLTLNEASGSATLTLTGTFDTGDFMVTNVAAGADVTLACFAGGTLIRTAHGDARVDDLRIGDQVVAPDGRLVPVQWIGHRKLDCTRHPVPRQVWPVRITSGTFGPGRPARDLFLSPDHAIHVDHVLIPVKHLINGTSIVQVTIDRIVYYHIQLPRHDLVLAEGLEVESYLDTGDRSNFANGDCRVILHPDFSAGIWEAHGCAPLVVTGPILDAVRHQLNVTPPAAPARQAARHTR